MTGLTIGCKNFFPAITRGKFGLLFLSRGTSSFFCRWQSLHRIEAVAGKISRIPSGIRPAGEDRETINRDQPNRERFKSDARFAFLALDRGVHFMNVGGLAIIHPLASERWWLWSLVVHFFGGAGGGEPAGAAAEPRGGAGGEAAGGGALAAPLTSLSGCV